MSINTAFRILTVCTGNICRSPMAERLLRAGFAAMVRALRLRTANPAGPEEDDVVDTYRRSDDVHDQMVHQLTPAVNTLLAWERRYR